MDGASPNFSLRSGPETRESRKIAKRRAAMEHNALMELYVDELKDLYDAENRLVKALPKVAKAATSEKLRSAVEEHLEQTKGHVDRLKEIFDNLAKKASVKKFAGMRAILKKDEKIMDEDYE